MSAVDLEAHKRRQFEEEKKRSETVIRRQRRPSHAHSELLHVKLSGARLAEGWLEKKARSGKNRWSKRWFKITSVGDFGYFSREADVKAKGMVRLCDKSSVEPVASPDKYHKFCFKVEPNLGEKAAAGENAPLICCAESGADVEKWVTRLRHIISLRHRNGFAAQLIHESMKPLNRGWLEKCARSSMSNFKKRYVRLLAEQGLVAYYVKETQKRPKGVLHLNAQSTVNSLQVIGKAWRVNHASGGARDRGPGTGGQRPGTGSTSYPANADRAASRSRHRTLWRL